MDSEVRRYILGVTMDDYESIETLSSQAIYLPSLVGKETSIEAISKAVEQLCIEGSLQCYEYSTTEKSFLVTRFQPGLEPDALWFLNRDSKALAHGN